jgi:hypothetical protein
MEALAAVGLASNIMQLVQVTINITATIREVRKSASGSSTETNKFRNLAELMRKDIDAFINPYPAQRAPHEDLQKFAKTMCSQLNEFEKELQKLQAKDLKN